MVEFRKGLRNLMYFNWKFGLILFLIFAIPRFIVVLRANQTGNYGSTSIIFMAMWILPFILLTKEGRQLIGLRMPTSYLWIIYSFILGILLSSSMYFLGNWFFGDSMSHWFVYIAKTFKVTDEHLTRADRNIYFIIYAIIGMTFSPIGEEFLYRGLIHQSFIKNLGDIGASYADSLSFAFTHLAHFGILYLNGSWQFMFIPALLWMILIFFSGQLFFYCKIKSNSILGAIVAHAGYNLAMTYFIFYHILI